MTSLKSKILWLSVCVLASCGDPVQMPQRVDEKREQPKKQASQEKIEVPSLFDTQKDSYTYNPVGKRDPFVPFSGEFVSYSVVPKTPLEKYSLNELNLTGIIWGISDPRALIKAPDGYSYIVRMDAPIGRNRGRVSRITKKELYVEEEYRDPTGKTVIKESKFELKKENAQVENDSDTFKVRETDG